jgi:aryl-alcohol dehydrogenase-like predicted oxidoreductase
MRFLDAFEAHSLGTLALGTAQLGMPYGVANKAGQPDAGRAATILAAAWDSGIRVIDTAQTYGDSERLLGSYFDAHPDQRFHVVTKLASTVEPTRDAIVHAALSSRNLLGRPLASLLLHNASAVENWSPQLQAGLEACLDLGIAESIGVSTYTPQQFRAAMDIPIVQVIQAPFNALDRRLLQGELLDRASESGRVLVLRSVFLQGLMILDGGEVPRRLGFAERDLARWRRQCAEHGQTPAAAALSYVRRVAPRALIAIGCETVEQLTANARLASEHNLSDGLLRAIETLPIPNERVLNPSLWPSE